MAHHSHAMEKCRQECRQCADTCQQTLFQHCLPQGGKHSEPEHIKLMTDCIQACQTAGDFMARDSRLAAAECAACAAVCEACAESCERIGGGPMKDCADVCRRCAEACREMSGMRQAA